MAKPVGTMVISLDLETAAYTKSQQKILAESKEAASTINGNFQRLGVTSDQIYTAMATRAELAFRKIGLSGKSSLAEVERSYAEMVAKVNASNQQMAKNPLFETLGIRSQAAIEAQKKAVIASYEAIKTTGNATARDLVNIERAKNEQLKTLNKEMVGDHEMSMASMTRAVLRFYAAYYVISTVVGVVGRAFMSGVEAIDNMQLSAVTVAATITNLQGTSGNVVENYKNNLIYAKALVPVLMQIDAFSLANLEQVRLINDALAVHGVILDGSNKKQIASMTALTNTIAIFTKGQNQTQQSIQETNAALNGEVTSRNRLALMLDQQIKRQGDYKDGLKGLNIEAQKHGDWLERIAPYLVGINAATGDISKTWEAVKTSLQTTWMILQTEIFADFYKGLVTSGQEAIGWARENAPLIGQYFKISMNVVGDAIGAVWGVLKGFAPMARDFGTAVGFVAYGWGGVFAALKPIGEFLGNSVQLAWELVKMIGNAAVAIGALATRQFAVADVAWEEAKKSAGKISELSEKNHKILTTDIMDSIAKYDLQYKAAKKATEAGYVPKVTPGKDTEDAKKAAAAREAAEKQITEVIRKNVYEREAVGKDNYEKDLIRINQEVEKYKEAGVSKALIAKYVASETAIAKAKQTDTELTEQIKIAKANQEYYDNAEKFLKELEIQLTASAKKREESEIHSWQKSSDAAVEAMEKEIALGLKLSMQTINKPQTEADEARKMVTFYNDIKGMEEQYRKEKLNWIEKEAALKRQKGEEEVATLKWVATQREMLNRENLKEIEEKFDYDNKYTKDTITNMGKVLDAAMNLYDKDSSEYNRLAEWKKGIQLAEIALEVAKNVQLLSFMVAQNAMYSAAMAKKAASLQLTAAEAVLTQGEGDPYTAFARIAAMMAIVAGVLSAVGVAGGFGGGGGSSVSSSPAYGQNTTVLGGANGQGSESITKSWELLQDTYDMENTKLTGIYNEMKNLNNNITGIVRGIISGGITGASFDTNSSGIKNTFETIANGAANLVELGTAGWLAFAAISPMLALTPAGWAVAAAIAVDKVLGVGIVGKAIGWISSGIFGGDITPGGSGISVQKGGTAVYPYQRWTESGGWFSSDKDRYKQGALNAELTNLFSGPNGIFTNLRSQMIGLAEVLGGDVAKASQSLEDLFGTFEINLAGLDAEGINKKLNEEISRISDNYAKVVFGELVNLYQKVGEGAYETVMRLTVDLFSILSIFEKIGEPMTLTGNAAIKLSEDLISLAGGLDKLTEAANAYYDKFFSDAEKQADLQESLTSIMEGMNLILPDTRAGYRYMTEEIQKAMFAGQEWAKSAYVTMLQLAENADQYYSTLEDAIEEATRANEDYVKSLQNITLTIQAWLDNLSLSSLAPVQSEAEWTRQYNEAKAKASLDNASEQDVNAYLSFATKYLEMQQKYGTADSYKAIYDAVVENVEGIGAGKDLALEIAQQQLTQLQIIAGNTAVGIGYERTDNGDGTYSGSSLINNEGKITADIGWYYANLRYMGHGQSWTTEAGDVYSWEEGLAKVQPVYPSWAFAEGGDHPGGWRMVGERGPELEYTPPSRIFSNKQTRSMLANLDASGNGGEVTVHSHIYLDGKEIQTCVSKGFKSNADLIQSARRAVN